MLNSVSSAQNQCNNVNFGMARVDKVGKKIVKNMGIEPVSVKGYYDEFYKSGKQLPNLLTQFKKGQDANIDDVTEAVNQFVNVVGECGLNEVIPPSLRAQFIKKQVIGHRTLGADNITKIESALNPPKKPKNAFMAFLQGIKEKVSPSPKQLPPEHADAVKDALQTLYAEDASTNPYLSKADTQRLFQAIENDLPDDVRNAFGHVLGLHSK